MYTSLKHLIFILYYDGIQKHFVVLSYHIKFRLDFAAILYVIYSSLAFVEIRFCDSIIWLLFFKQLVLLFFKQVVMKISIERNDLLTDVKKSETLSIILRKPKRPNWKSGPKIKKVILLSCSFDFVLLMLRQQIFDRIVDII